MQQLVIGIVLLLLIGLQLSFCTINLNDEYTAEFGRPIPSPCTPECKEPAECPTPCQKRRYSLPGPQVEPEAACWAPLPCIKQSELLSLASQIPRYPTDPAIIENELKELRYLAFVREDPTKIAGSVPGIPNTERRELSFFLNLRPQPLGAVIDHTRPATEPVIQNGRELARLFEAETPGLYHRHALNWIFANTPAKNWSPPRQAYVWAALDLAISNALTLAWNVKWENDNTRFRPRPIECDPNLDILFDRQVITIDASSGATRPSPNPSPGTPRHPAYPSGHSTYSGAASEMLSFFFPQFRDDFDKLADNIGLARLWAGIHWRSDHIQGVELGRKVAKQIIDKIGDSFDPVRGRNCPPKEGTVCPP